MAVGELVMRWPLSFRIAGFLGRVSYRLARFTILSFGFTLLGALLLETFIRPPTEPECAKQGFSTWQTLRDNPKFSSFDAHFRLSEETLQNGIEKLTGSRIVPNGGAFEAVDIDAQFGQPHISMDFCGARTRVPISLRVWQLVVLRLEADSVLTYGTSKYISGEKPEESTFNIEFRSDVQKLRLGYSWWQTLADWFPRVVGHLESALARMFKPASVPASVPAAFAIDLGTSQKEVVEFEKIYLKSKPQNAAKVIAGKVTLLVTIPSHPILIYLDFERPLFSPSGVWLLARAVPKLPDNLRDPAATPTEVKPAELQSMLQDATEGFATDAGASLWINDSALKGVAARIANLPEASRTVSVVSIAREGNLGEIAATDKNLGDLFSLKAEVPRDNAWKGTTVAQLGVSASGSGISVSGDMKAELKAALRLTVKGPFGPPLSVDPEVSGSAKTHIKGDLKTFSQNIAGVRSVYWGIDLACTTAAAELKSSGGQFGDLPITYGDVEADLAIPLFRDPTRPSLMVDGLPIRIPLAKEEAAEGNDQEDGPIRFAPSNPGLDMTLGFRDVERVNDGTQISADVSFAPADAATWSVSQIEHR
ncbi:hypothetical protein, partial [Mesorhizobium sp. P17.1]